MAGVVSALFSTDPAMAYGDVFSTFSGDDAAGMRLSLYTSADALNFTLLSNTGFGGSSGYIRDPSIMKHVDGMYYVAYTDPLTDNCCGKEDHFSIAKSTDLSHWTNLTTVDAGVPGVAHTWAPEWYIEKGTVYVTANIDTLNTDSDFKPYLFTALDSTLTSWSAPVPLGFGPNYIDTFVLKVGATYHAFAKNETTRYCEHATAPALILVGVLMTQSIAQIAWHDFSEAVPAFITMLATPLTFSIATGLSLGLISYTIVKIAAGKFREITVLIWILTALFILRYVYLAAA